MTTEHSMVSLFETFITDTAKGKRRQLNGQRIKPQSWANYKYVLKLLKEYEVYSKKQLVLNASTESNEAMFLRERKYWKQFYYSFSDFLLYEKNCFDNYAGCVFKILKCFLRYMKEEKLPGLSTFYEQFYVRHEDIRIITLLPERFYFLVTSEAFEKRLSCTMRRWKDVFVFGCMAALRFCDLMNLRVRDITNNNGSYFLYYRSLKTDTPVTMKLPGFAVKIFLKYAKYKRGNARLFPQVCLSQYNKDIRKIMKLAGWNEAVGKIRSRDGEAVAVSHVTTLKEGRVAGGVNGNGRGNSVAGKATSNGGRFYELVTSHVMRRTGITLLLMMGMPEYIVRKISGHSAHSKSFFRYVNFADSYVTDEIDKVYGRLQELYGGRIS